MVAGNRIRVAVTAAALLFTALATQGQCVSTLRSIAQINAFPNRPPAQIASTGSLYGLARVEPQSTAHSIYFTIVNHDLEPVTADRLVIDRTLNGPLALHWDGTTFGLFYQAGDNQQLYLQRLDTNGNLVGGPVAIAASHIQWPNQEYDTAWNPIVGAYLVLHTIPQGFDKGLWLTVVKPDGTQLLDRSVTGFFNGEETTPRLAVAANGSMLLVWRRDDGFWGLGYTSSFDLIGTTRVSTTLGLRPSLASNGTSYLLVFTAPATPREVHSVGISAGATPGSEAILAKASGMDIAPISLAWNPTLHEWGMVYVDAPNGLGIFPTDTRLRRLTGSSTTVADTELSPDIIKYDYQTHYPVIADGSGYVGGIERFISNAEGGDSYLVRNCALTLSGAADTPFAPVLSNVTFRVTPSGGFPGYSYFWDFGDLNQTTGGAVITHRYEHTGTYTVTVTATDQQKATTTTTFTVTVVKPKVRAARH
jgi:hypothetical protein